MSKIYSGSPLNHYSKKSNYGITNLMILLLLVMLFVMSSFAIASKNQQRIVAHLTQMGATEITVKHRYFDFDKSNLTFDVSYRDASGNNHVTRLKVREWSVGSDIVWEKEP